MKIGCNDIFARTADSHHHHYSRMMGAAAAPTSDPDPDHFADFEGVGLFTVTSGINDWGTAVQILGADDTPVFPGGVKIDPGVIEIEDVDTIDQEYLFRFIAGLTAAAGVSAGPFSGFSIVSPTGRFTGFPVEFGFDQVPVGTKLWVQIKTPSANTKSADFSFVLHEYNF